MMSVFLNNQVIKALILNKALRRVNNGDSERKDLREFYQGVEREGKERELEAPGKKEKVVFIFIDHKTRLLYFHKTKNT